MALKFCGECGAKLPAPDGACPTCTLPPESDRQEGDIEPFRWMGQDRYRCPLTWESGVKCTYDSYDLDVLREHIGQPHTASGEAKKSNTRTVVSPLYDHKGKQIVRQEFKDRNVPDSLKNLKFKQ